MGVDWVSVAATLLWLGIVAYLLAMLGRHVRERNALADCVMTLHDENAAFRRIMADQLRRGGCPDDLIDEAIDKAVRDA